MQNFLKAGLAALLLSLASTSMSLAGEYVSVNNADIFYKSAGDGTAIVLAPGWTMTSDVFENQIAELSKTYRVIAYDTRSQGRSSKTLENNSYEQHGEDLGALLEHLDVQKFVFIGHSAGCFDGYSYVRQFGTSHLAGFVCVDQPPKGLSETSTDWALGDRKFWQGFVGTTSADRLKLVDGMVNSLTEKKLSSDDYEWLVSQSILTPTFAAVSLLASAAFSDYEQEAKDIATTVPYLNIVREEWSETAKAWLSTNTPRSKIVVLGKHLMFWERPDEFNQAIVEFLTESDI